jgi:XTP/dITP diphosphohydrolase
MPTLVVATGNPGKLAEMQAYLTDLAWQLALKPAELDVEETGSTFLENACLKASQVAAALGSWAIADDSGLMVDALGGAPGIYSARYGTDDGDRIQRLLRELGDAADRTAEGICRGEILRAPRGSGGFGYDPIFYVPTEKLTFAEMPPALKHTVSHRGQAFLALLPQLPALLTETP